MARSMTSPLSVLVTGGAGFIGANLCRRLGQDPLVGAVRVLDDLSTGTRANLDGCAATLIQGDINDPEALDHAIEDCDAVIHLAAVPSVPRSIVDPLRSHHANATGTLHVLEAARKNRTHVVLASSSSVYGANPALPKSEDLECRPVSPYAVSKLASEQYAMAYAHSYDLPVLPFRFFNVFGPLQPAGHAYAAVVPAFIDAALHDRPLQIQGDGSQSRDFTYVDTVSDALALAVTGRVTSSPVNLAFGTRTTLNELIDLLELVLEKRVTRHLVDPRPGDVAHSQADGRRLLKLLPNIRSTSLLDGLRQTAEWWRNESSRSSPST